MFLSKLLHFSSIFGRRAGLPTANLSSTTKQVVEQHEISSNLHQSIFTFNYLKHHCGYLILEKKTKSLIAVDPGDFQAVYYNILNLEKMYKAKFTHILCTHHHPEHTASADNFKVLYP